MKIRWFYGFLVKEEDSLRKARDRLIDQLSRNSPCKPSPDANISKLI
jgi:hypothetical protein